MRILFVSQDFLPSIGGISEMVHGLAEACGELGHDVTVLAPGAYDGNGASRSYRTIRDARPQPTRDQRFARLLYARDTNRAVCEAVGDVQPDAILLGVYRTYAAACLLARKRFGIPLGGLVHGFDVLSAFRDQRLRFPTLMRPVVGFPTPRRHVLRYLRDADRIFANSSATSAHVERNSGRKPVTIGCGVPTPVVSRMIAVEKSNSERSATRARLGLPEAPTVGFLGRLVARKNVEVIIQSLSDLRDCNALIVGDGPMRAHIQNLARQLGVSERVAFVGQIEESRKHEYLRAMDIFCLPSREIGGYDIEGFGIVLLEAAAAGVPVVGGRSGGIPDVIQHEQTGLLADPNDPRDVARCLRRLLEDRQLAARCVSAAQARLRDDFNWSAIAQRVVGELTDAVAEMK